MSSGRPEQRPRPERREGVIPLGPLDSTIIHRARAINADALRLIDEVLDQIAQTERG